MYPIEAIYNFITRIFTTPPRRNRITPKLLEEYVRAQAGTVLVAVDRTLNT